MFLFILRIRYVISQNEPKREKRQRIPTIEVVYSVSFDTGEGASPTNIVAPSPAGEKEIVEERSLVTPVEVLKHLVARDNLIEYSQLAFISPHCRASLSFKNQVTILT